MTETIFQSKNKLKYSIEFVKMYGYPHAIVISEIGIKYQIFIGHGKIWWSDNYDKIPDDVRNMTEKMWLMKEFI